jgi:hypothetical protein
MLCVCMSKGACSGCTAYCQCVYVCMYVCMHSCMLCVCMSKGMSAHFLLWMHCILHESYCSMHACMSNVCILYTHTHTHTPCAFPTVLSGCLRHSGWIHTHAHAHTPDNLAILHVHIQNRHAHKPGNKLSAPYAYRIYLSIYLCTYTYKTHICACILTKRQALCILWMSPANSSSSWTL